MFISRLISEFAEYHRTSDYVRGVLVEMTGILIEVLLLSITIPIVLYFIQRVRTRPVRATVDFYLFQIFHKITRMFLRMASIEDIMPMLSDEQTRNPKFEIYSHFVYGNLENILFVLKKTFGKRGEFLAQVEKRSLAEFKAFRDIADRCIEEIDRLAAMLVSVPSIQHELFQMRILVYPLRDLCAKVTEDIQRSEEEPIRKNFHSYDVQRMVEQLTEIIEEIFTKRRKLIDSMMKHQQWRSKIYMILSLPYILIRRWVQIRVCRLRNKPYQDFISPSPIPEMLQDWRSFRGITREQAADIWGISLDDYYDYEQGYRQPTMEVWETIKPELRSVDSKDNINTNRTSSCS